ncbi:YwbE family protein [Polaribacter sp. Asnod6-C07]|uniref:YwbE family protein n=1 Tax=Polaribacter sp. Asnod6-C07 TaxID=3160582 RepID=UPI0038708FC5
MIDCRQRKNIKVGLFVEIVQKPHQKTGELTEGIVARLLTNSPNHPYGIKVQLESGLVGRVKNIIE